MTFPIPRRRWALALLALVALVPAARAQDYPTKPIRLILTSTPGSLVDTVGRLLGAGLGARLGKVVVVENRVGAATQIGFEAAARSPADGYTLLLGSLEMALLPSTKKKLSFDPIKDFAPIARAVTSWTVYAVNPKLPINTLAELVSYAKAHPGEIRYGSNGIGGTLHMAAELLQMRTGIKLVHVPYKGGAQAVADVIAGQIEMGSLGIASTASRPPEQLRILAQTGPTRHPAIPRVPTTAELGLPDVGVGTWFGLLAPAGTPPAIVARLGRETAVVLEPQPLRDKLAAMGCEAAWLSPEAFGAFIAEETTRWARVLPAMGILPEE